MSKAPDLNARDFAFNQVMSTTRSGAQLEKAGGGLLFRASVVAVIAGAVVCVRNWLQPATAKAAGESAEELQVSALQPSPAPNDDSVGPDILERTDDGEGDDTEDDDAGTPTLASMLDQRALYHAAMPMPLQLPTRRGGHNDNSIDLQPINAGFFDTLVFRPAALAIPSLAAGSGSGGGGGSSDSGAVGGGRTSGNGSGETSSGPGDSPDDDSGLGPRRNAAPIVTGPVLLGSLTLSSALLIGLPDLLRNAFDGDGDALNVLVVTPSSGRITQLPDGHYLFVAGHEDIGTVTFTYTITDGTASVAGRAMLTLEAPTGLSMSAAGSSTLIGTPQADTLIGTPAADVIDAREGDDLVIGREGRDVIFGGAGNDRIIAGDGDDIVLAGAGADVVLGGKGNDILLGEEGDDVLLGEEGEDALIGGEGDDVLAGGANSDRIDGGTGDDRIVAEAGDGSDIIDGGEGVDTIDLASTTAAARVDLAAGLVTSADVGQDTITGIENAIGGSGNDFFIASNAQNAFTGGSGEDTFVFRTVASIGRGETRDRIMDFEAGDRIDLDDIAKELEDAVEDAFQKAAIHRFILLGPDEAFTKPGQLKLAHVSADVGPTPYALLMGNVDDDSEADFEIELYGQHTFTIDDFRGHA